MEQLTLDTLKALAQHEPSPKVSAFMPTFRSGQDVQQNPTRYKNLINEIERRLTEREMPTAERDAMLDAIRGPLDIPELWTHPTDGLAIFAAPGAFQIYQLPVPVEENLVISPHYTFTPVLPLLTGDSRFYILAISQNAVRFFGANRYSVWPIELPEDTPDSIAEALRFDDPERELQFHTGTAQGGRRDAMFYGTGAGDIDNKERIQRYLNIVDATLKPMLREQSTPLVLAAVDYLHPIYRDQSEYPHVMEQGIIGNPEMLRPEELHAQAWPIVEPVFHQEIDAAKEVYGNLSATERSSTDLREIVSASVWARVDTLFVAEGSEEWGTFDPASSKVVIRKEGPRTYEDLALVDFAATHTMLNGGAVYVLPQEDMPADKPVAAIFRWEQEK